MLETCFLDLKIIFINLYRPKTNNVHRIENANKKIDIFPNKKKIFAEEM